MKKFLFTFLMMLTMMLGTSIDANAQTYNYRSTEFSYKYMNNNGYWTNWSEWEPSNIRIKIDFDDDTIIIYSKSVQVYQVTDYLGKYTDESGGQQTKFKVIDQDSDIGTVRLRIEQNGNSQLYVDFADVMWVYNVRRIY